VGAEVVYAGWDEAGRFWRGMTVKI